MLASSVILTALLALSSLGQVTSDQLRKVVAEETVGPVTSAQDPAVLAARIAGRRPLITTITM